jgi:hypothetical protein
VRPPQTYRVIRFEYGVHSHAYAHAAEVIIGHNGYTLKDKGGAPGRRASDAELAECVTITQRMAREQVQAQRASAEHVIREWLNKLSR